MVLVVFSCLACSVKVLVKNRVLSVAVLALIGTIVFMARDISLVEDVNLYRREFEGLSTFMSIFSSSLFWKGEHAFLFLMFILNFSFGKAGFVILVWIMFFLFFTSVVDLSVTLGIDKYSAIVMFINLVAANLVLFNTLRQGFAVIFLFFAMSAGLKHSLLKMMLMICAGYFFHKSVFIPGVLFIILVCSKYVLFWISSVLIVPLFYIFGFSYIKLKFFQYSGLSNPDFIIDLVKACSMFVVLSIAFVSRGRLTRLIRFSLMLFVICVPLLFIDKIGSRLLLYVQCLVPFILLPGLEKMRISSGVIMVVSIIYGFLISFSPQMKSLFIGLI